MSKSKDVAIEVKNLSKHFRLPTEKSNSVKQTFVNWTHGVKGYEEQKVLRDISFNVEKGDFFGIVGRNGSGKSTLLKLISGIYGADSGSIKINGSLVSFIELGVGFNTELTGRENIYLNGALMGFSKEEVDDMYDKIVDFAELGEFMEQKLKNYSSGMQVRLAFSCAIRAESDILVLDEVLAVGDEAFQRKCNNYFATLRRDRKTVILVTHSMDAIQQYCNKAIMIDDGRIVKSGKTTEVAQAYRELFMKDDEKIERTDNAIGNRFFSADVKVVDREKSLEFNVALDPKIDVEDAVITFVINRDNGEMAYRWVTDEKISEKIHLKKGRQFRLSLKLQNIFPDGVFDIQVGVKNRERSKDYAIFNAITKFEIISKGSYTYDIYWKPHEEHSYEE